MTAIAVAASVATSGAPLPGVSSGAAGLWHGVPRYYFVVPWNVNAVDAKSAAIVVRDTRSGVELASRPSPPGCELEEVSAAADDETIALACIYASKPGPGMTARLFLGHFAPASGQLTLTAMRIPPIRAYQGFAISPDGARIAVLSAANRNSPKAGPTTTLRVYAIATGAFRSWSGAGNADFQGAGGMRWGPGSMLAFGYHSAVNQRFSGIRVLSTSALAGGLLTASRLAVRADDLPAGYRDIGLIAISGNGQKLVTVLNARGRAPGISEFAEFSLANGKMLRHWLPAHNEDPSELAIWTNHTGSTLVAGAPIRHGSRIISVLGIMTGEKFTPLRRAPELPGYFLNNVAF